MSYGYADRVGCSELVKGDGNRCFCSMTAQQFTDIPDYELLPYFAQVDHIGRYESGMVFIGDRSKFPFERSYVSCESVEEVAKAIESMVTQGIGPHIVAAYAMVMAARRSDVEGGDKYKVLSEARDRLVATRPTNTSTVRILDRMLKIAGKEIANKCPTLEQPLLEWVQRDIFSVYERTHAQAVHAANVIADGDGILTMCFAEAPFVWSLAIASHVQGKSLSVYVPETRPYLQGARLTAPSVHEVGVPVKLITDNMPAYIMSQGKIQKYFTAADLVTLDGHVVNKIGTYQNAICAHHHSIPYFAFTRGPDPARPTSESVVIEERDPSDIRRCRGVPTTVDEIDAYYPAFDITSPHLVAGIITNLGVLSPYSIAKHYGRNSTGSDSI